MAAEHSSGDTVAPEIPRIPEILREAGCRLSTVRAALSGAGDLIQTDDKASAVLCLAAGELERIGDTIDRLWLALAKGEDARVAQ